MPYPWESLFAEADVEGPTGTRPEDHAPEGKAGKHAGGTKCPDTFAPGDEDGEFLRRSRLRAGRELSYQKAIDLAKSEDAEGERREELDRSAMAARRLRAYARSDNAPDENTQHYLRHVARRSMPD